MTTVTKRDLAHSVAEHTGCRKIMAMKMVDILFESMRGQ